MSQTPFRYLQHGTLGGARLAKIAAENLEPNQISGRERQTEKGDSWRRWQFPPGMVAACRPGRGWGVTSAGIVGLKNFGGGCGNITIFQEGE